MRIKVYIAGPYTTPDPCENTHKALTVGMALWNLGYAPYVPHLTHFWHTVSPMPYETWLDMDLEWLRVCNAVLRLPGESVGADQEVNVARHWGIPIYTSIGELVKGLPS